MPAVVPGPPGAPTVSDVFKDSVRLSWAAPAADGGAPVTGYYVERRSSTAKRWVFVTREPVTATDCTVRDLYEDTVYEFRVTAENKMGTGPASEPSGPVTAHDPWGRQTRRACHVRVG